MPSEPTPGNTPRKTPPNSPRICFAMRSRGCTLTGKRCSVFTLRRQLRGTVHFYQCRSAPQGNCGDQRNRSLAKGGEPPFYRSPREVQGLGGGSVRLGLERSAFLLNNSLESLPPTRGEPEPVRFVTAASNLRPPLHKVRAEWNHPSNRFRRLSRCHEHLRPCFRHPPAFVESFWFRLCAGYNIYV